MNPAYEAYDRALAKVADARTAHEAALVELDEVQRPIKAQLDRAWDLNQQAVIAASTAVEAAVQNLARVQVEGGTAARARVRGKGQPVLNDDEVALVVAAEAALADAQAAHAEAKARFKQGVTAEQLDALD